MRGVVRVLDEPVLRGEEGRDNRSHVEPMDEVVEDGAQGGIREVVATVVDDELPDAPPTDESDDPLSQDV